MTVIPIQKTTIRSWSFSVPLIRRYTSSQPTLSQTYRSARIVNPITEYNQHLRSKRKQYLAEHLQKKKELEKKAAEQQTVPTTGEMSFSDDLSKEVKSKKTPVDHILRKPASSDEAHMSTWRKMAQEDAKKRYARYLLDEKSKSETRLESLLYLYYSASDFITYDNMDAKLDGLLSMPSESPMVSLHENESVADRKELIEKREQILQQVLMGTMDGEHPSASAIQDMASHSST